MLSAGLTNDVFDKFIFTMPPVVIRLLDAEGKEVQDSISGEYEDSFCLESFEDLCKAHFAAEPKNTKCFIIARVQTVDPKQPDKEFYSYYNAFHLNKTLFQTQIYLKKRYIHRLHVLNPLTNSDIIGNVQYYMVKPPKVEETVKVDIPADPSPAPVAAPGITQKMSQRKMSIVYTQQESSHEANLSFLPPTKKDMVINMHQVQLEETSEIRHAPGLLKKLGLGKRSSLGGYESNFSNGRRNTLTSFPVANFAPAMTDKTGKRRQSDSPQLYVHSMSPMGSISVGDTEKKAAQLGTVTRFTVPVPKEEMDQVIPKTQRGNRRSLSYRNAVSASGVPASFLEWAKMVSEEYKASATTAEPSALPDQPADASVNYDVVVFSGSGNRTGRPSRISIPRPYNQTSPGTIATPNLNTIKDEDEEAGSPITGTNGPPPPPQAAVETKEGTATDQTPVAASVPAPVVLEDLDDDDFEEEVTLKVFDAVLFATDSDFLETSKTRQIFRSNAIQPEDAKLFEMKELTGTETTPQDFEIIRDTFPCEFCYPSEQEMARMSPCSRFLHTHKCMILASLIVLLIIGKSQLLTYLTNHTLL